MNARALVLPVLFAIASPALAGPSDLIGRWGQVNSTGGECPTCALSIVQKGDRFEVRANNGWTAEVSEPDVSRGAFFVGTGQWAAWGERPVRIVLFIQKDGDLFMKMAIPQPNGGNRIVSAVFRRDASV